MHSGSTTSSAPWRTASFTSCVEISILYWTSPRRASVWVTAARKRFFFIVFSPEDVRRSSVDDFTLEDGEAVALELDEARVDHAFGATRPWQINLHGIGHPRRPTGQQ